MDCEQFVLSIKHHTEEAGYQVTHLQVTDRYHHRPFKVERSLFLAFTNLLQGYLANRPHVHFEHKRNLARPLVYLPPGVRAWTAYMPGGLATQPVHNPEMKTLASGKRIDAMTRRLFRHSMDAIGLRSRAYIMTWRLTILSEQNSSPLVWLSLASGSGQPVYDAVEVVGSAKFRSVIVTDGDEKTLAFAKQLAQKEGAVATTNLYFESLEVFDDHAFDRLFELHHPSVVDAMGLFEYLNPTQATQLLRRVYAKLPEKGTFIFTNMSPEHPHLDLHKRGLGWPGVITRTVEDMAKILEGAGVQPEAVQIYRADDNVYNVYQIVKRKA